MKFNFSIAIILLILTVWIIQAIGIAVSQRKLSWVSAINLLASACLLVGATGFLGSGLSASGGLDWLPPSFEWPIGKANGVIIQEDGTVIVPHEPSGRVQVYNNSLEFQRGWTVDAGGGMFTLHPMEDQTFRVYAARGSKWFRYDSKGTLLDTGKYLKKPTEGAAFREVSIPTPWYLLVFTHPFASWGVAAFGMLLLYITGRFGKPKPNK